MIMDQADDGNMDGWLCLLRPNRFHRDKKTKDNDEFFHGAPAE
jgi:hypothetical protein